MPTINDPLDPFTLSRKKYERHNGRLLALHQLGVNGDAPILDEVPRVFPVVALDRWQLLRVRPQPAQGVGTPLENGFVVRIAPIDIELAWG
jgi:hypothetical protein